MKNSLAISCFVLLFQNLNAQHTEIHGGVNLALFSFSGPSSANSSFIIRPDVNKPGSNYTNDIYGKESRPGVGIEFSISRVSRSKIIYGISAAFDVLKSRVNVDRANSVALGDQQGVGFVVLTSKFLDIRPFIGYRFLIDKKTGVDFAGSMDLGVGLGAQHEKGSIEFHTDGGTTTDIDRDRAGFDLRAGVQARIFKKRISLLTGYWFGLPNYYRGYIGANNEAYSKLFRLGIHYLVNK